MEIYENRAEDSSESDEEPYVAPPELVQINCTSSEMKQMINSFITGKRIRANKRNILEYCGSADNDSCARVSAVNFVRKGLVEVQDAQEYWSKMEKS